MNKRLELIQHYKNDQIVTIENNKKKTHNLPRLSVLCLINIKQISQLMEPFF